MIQSHNNYQGQDGELSETKPLQIARPFFRPSTMSGAAALELKYEPRKSTTRREKF
jgi:hypothetical protein